MADSIILATARLYEAEIVTSDAECEGGQAQKRVARSKIKTNTRCQPMAGADGDELRQLLTPGP